MNTQVPVVSLQASDSRQMAELIRRADLSQMPAGKPSLLGDEADVMRPLLDTYRLYEIELMATVEERLSSLLVVARGFPDEKCWWLASLIVDPKKRRCRHADRKSVV